MFKKILSQYQLGFQEIQQKLRIRIFLNCHSIVKRDLKIFFH